MKNLTIERIGIVVLTLIIMLATSVMYYLINNPMAANSVGNF